MPVKKIISQENKTGGAYVVTVDMGYGHQRAAYPLHDMARLPPSWTNSHTIVANSYPGIPTSDKQKWNGSRAVYEFISRFKKVPLLGKAAFDFMDYLQRIEPFYPKRDLTAPSSQLKSTYRWIRKGWGKHLIDTLNQSPLPMVNTFFIPAFFAEEHGYKGDIYCLCTDTDVSRAWAPLNPKKSRIKYLAPNNRVKQRLMRYGVKEENIFITGFPLPKENIGGKTMKTLKESLGCRISNLDPKGRYQKKYQATIETYLGARYCNIRSQHPLTITFAVGGAGAQREIGVDILESLRAHISDGSVRLNLVAGTRNDVYKFYEKKIDELQLRKQQGKTVTIVYSDSKVEYFKEFNKILLTTDILWTKPSELSFYAGLGLPVIIAPPIGSQELYNRSWLHSIGAGFDQEDPRYTHEWLFDWLNSGALAEAAMEGYLDAPKMGAYHIESIVVKGKRSEIEDLHLI